MTSRPTILTIIAISVTMINSGHAMAGREGNSANPAIAWYHDHYIDLRFSWEGAQACTSDGETTICYESESEMTGAVSSRSGSGAISLLGCSSNLNLYTATNYGTPLLQLTARQTYINLSVYGFDNVVSSYKVGACSSTFYDGSSGSGSVYPGATTANVQSTSMTSGWDNRISSVYIS